MPLNLSNVPRENLVPHDILTTMRRALILAGVLSLAPTASRAEHALIDPQRVVALAKQAPCIWTVLTSDHPEAQLDMRKMLMREIPESLKLTTKSWRQSDNFNMLRSVGQPGTTIAAQTMQKYFFFSIQSPQCAQPTSEPGAIGCPTFILKEAAPNRWFYYGRIQAARLCLPADNALAAYSLSKTDSNWADVGSYKLDPQMGLIPAPLTHLPANASGLGKVEPDDESRILDPED